MMEMRRVMQVWQRVMPVVYVAVNVNVFTAVRYVAGSSP